MENRANDNELNLYTLEQDEVDDSKNPFTSILSMLDEKIKDILDTDEEHIDSSEEEDDEKEPITLDQSRLFKKKIIEQRQELETLFDKKEKYKLQTGKLREENQGLHEKLEEITEEIHVLNEEIKELKEETHTLNETCSHLTKDKEGTSSKNEILEKRVNDLTKTISELYGILRMSKEFKN